jgi:hypothetical protein
MKPIFIISIVSAALCQTATASPATYTLSGTGTGILGADPFSDASFSITTVADTSGITESLGVFSLSNSIATLFVSGVGTATFTVPTMIVDNTAGVAGVSAPNQNKAILGDSNAAFSSYDLSSSLSPVSGSPLLNPNTGFGTTAGDFSLTSVSFVSFQAEVVPEPSVFALFGLASLCFILRTRMYIPRRHGLQRTRHDVAVCNGCAPCAGSLNLGRWV